MPQTYHIAAFAFNHRQSPWNSSPSGLLEGAQTGVKKEKVLGKDKKKTRIRDDIYDPIKVQYDEDGVLFHQRKTNRVDERVNEFLEAWEKRKMGILPMPDLTIICSRCGTEIRGDESGLNLQSWALLVFPASG